MVFVRPSSKTAERDAARHHREKAYAARNELIALLARIWPSHVTPVSKGTLSTLNKLDPEHQRRTICIHPPTGEVICWMVSLKEVEEHFAFVPTADQTHWDGATNAERTARINALGLALGHAEETPALPPNLTVQRPKRRTKAKTPREAVIADSQARGLNIEHLEPRRPGDFSRRR